MALDSAKNVSKDIDLTTQECVSTLMNTAGISVNRDTVQIVIGYSSSISTTNARLRIVTVLPIREADASNVKIISTSIVGFVTPMPKAVPSKPISENAKNVRVDTNWMIGCAHRRLLSLPGIPLIWISGLESLTRMLLSPNLFSLLERPINSTLIPQSPKAKEKSSTLPLLKEENHSKLMMTMMLMAGPLKVPLKISSLVLSWTSWRPSMHWISSISEETLFPDLLLRNLMMELPFLEFLS